MQTDTPMRTTRFAAAVLGLCMAASSAVAADSTEGADLDAIRAQQTELRAEAQSGAGVFEKMSQPERAGLVAKQDHLLAMIEGKQELAELDDASKVAAFNLLQDINAIVNKAEGSQVYCEYVKKTGSHRKVKQCMTFAERREMQAEAQRVLHKEGLRGYNMEGQGN